MDGSIIERGKPSLQDDAPAEKVPEEDPLEHGRSPIQRFRSYPKRPLTVTDLTAGAWCELQYWYTLTRLPGGRKTRTTAMKGGSKVHQKLEDEVHTTVVVEVATKEDSFALRLWNLVQGLRTLRAAGLTRELEVWGMADGNFVNGVIDVLTREEDAQTKSEIVQPPDQAPLMRYFTRSTKNSAKAATYKVYLADVKTRGSAAPVSEAVIRPAKVQLLLYHQFLADMAAGKLDFFKLFRRYGLDADDLLSDAFLAQISELHDDVLQDCGQHAKADSAEASNINYRTLRELVTLVTAEMNLTFPSGEGSLGSILRVQYVHRDDGRQLKVHEFQVNDTDIDTYLHRNMQWWRGERWPKGVQIEEAFKCRTCEFTSDCSWRNSMDEQQIKRAQQRAWARQNAKAGESERSAPS